MSSISDTDRAIQSRAQQTREVSSSIYEPARQALSASRAVDSDLYRKTFALPDEHDLIILDLLKRDIDRNNWRRTFDALIDDMARTNGPLSEDYQDSKRKLALHHARYRVRVLFLLGSSLLS
jgi:hypothetical protein